MNLITGCFRSATKYTSYLMNAWGLDMPHEKIGKHGTVSAYHAFNDDIKWNIILHQVRDPLKVLGTLKSCQRGTALYIQENIECSNDFYKLENLMYVWVEFNKKITNCAHYRYRIEDIKNEYKNIQQHLGLSGKFLPKISEKTNTRMHGGEYKYPTKDELIKEDKNMAIQVFNLASKYGYDY